MSRLRKQIKSVTVPKLAIAIGVLALLVVPYDVGFSDDTFLFRKQSGKPYVWVFLDTSSSMNLSAELGGQFVESNADSPFSTFYQAKTAVYEVFNEAYKTQGDFIHYGFMSYNQDGMRVRGKNWLYAWDPGSPQLFFGAAGVAWPMDDGLGNGELITFGAPLPTTASPDPVLLPMFDDPTYGTVLGSCEQPVNLSANRAAVNRFPKLEPLDNVVPADGYLDDMASTKMWLEEDGIVYEVLVEKHSESGVFLLGQSSILVDFTVDEYIDGCDASDGQTKANIKFDYVRPFLLHDLLGADNVTDLTGEDVGPGTRKAEAQVGIYNYQAYEARAVCGDDKHPFTGTGGELNYDGPSTPFGGDPADFPNVDPFLIGNPSINHPDLTLKFPTTLETAPACVADAQDEMRTLDIGDMLPYHWERTNREEFFQRMAPNWSPGKAMNDLDFGIASYFKDVPNKFGFLDLINPDQKPLMAFGDSPIGESLVDWRCFYLGSDQPGGKCRIDEQPFGRGWDWLAPQCDLEWGCRKPFLIIIGDGENNCRGENPAADTANLRRNRIEAWVINFGGPESKDLRSLARNTGGEYIEVDDRDELLTVLQNILGEIVEETRAFASAVVPTVQAEEADKIFVSNFKPLNQASVWPGNIQAFLKPVPLTGEGRPDTSIDCANDPDTDPASECFLWNASEEMLDQVDPDIATQFGITPAQRRVYYSRLSAPGEWPLTRRYAAPTERDTNSTADRYDLWRGMGLISPNVTDGSLDEATEDTHEANANAALTGMMALKMDDNDTPDDVADDTDYILGDIFHSDPLIVGTPINTKFFALNLEDDGTACEDGNPSYRCFFRKHQNRRKIVLVGSNDGQVHAVDAGIYRTGGAFADQFDRGSGKEVFAWVPREILPTVKRLYKDGFGRDWSVDGPMTGLDVFMDPLNDSATFPDVDDREWRTVVVAGLRRGGDAYYALDVTQPDKYDGNDQPIGIDQYVPSCTNADPGNCGPLPYPAQLWEFTDSHLLTNPLREIPFDLDQDGLEDMVESWSVPSLGLIQVCTDDTNCDPTDPDAFIEDRYVAAVGGGLDKSNATGNYLYLIDVETGQAIYKQELLDGVASGGSAASEPAAVDTDGDGYLDRIYVGTTKGFIYRADLRFDNEVPLIDDTFDWIQGGLGLHLPIAVERIMDTDYAPKLLFKAQPDALTPATASRALYYRPSVIFSAALGQYVLAFGTGDRENLWTSDGTRGEFYVFKDDIAPGNPFDTVYTEADLEPIDSEVDTDTELNFLTAPGLATKGWHMTLRHDERLITNPFAVSGVLVFTVFDPDVEVDLKELTCSRTGRSRVFGVTATNGNGLLYDGGSRTRWFDIADFVTEPYIEQSQTKNPDSGNDTPTADDLTADHLSIMEELKKLFPTNCKFANYRLDIKTLSSDTGIHLIAPVPICIVEKNWKEF